MIRMNYEIFHRCISRSAVPVLAAFCSARCGYCRQLQPALRRISQSWGERLLLGQVDIDSDFLLAMEEQIEVVPTLVLYDQGRALGSIVVPDRGEHIEEFLRETLENSRREGTV